MSHTLVSYDTKYVYMEKLCLVMIFVTKKLYHYMLNQTAHVVSNIDPLKYMNENITIVGQQNG